MPYNLPTLLHVKDKNTPKMYIYVRSDDSSNVHFSNSTTSFTAEINPPLQLENGSRWTCALTECDLGDNYEGELYIYCDLVGLSIVKGKWRNILRIVNKGGIFSKPYYKPVIKHYIDQIHFYITSYDDAKIIPKPEQVRMVLNLLEH